MRKLPLFWGVAGPVMILAVILAALSNSWYTRAAILMPAERLLTEPTDEELASLEGLSAAVDRAYLAVEAARGAIACEPERLSCRR